MRTVIVIFTREKKAVTVVSGDIQAENYNESASSNDLINPTSSDDHRNQYIFENAATIGLAALNIALGTLSPFVINILTGGLAIFG